VPHLKMRRIGKTGKAGADPPLYATTKPKIPLELIFWEGWVEDNSWARRPALD